METYQFKYETLEEIAEDCERRKLSIHFAKNIDILYEPLQIGGRRLGNRLAILPMEGSDATADGEPGELTRRRWKRFACGGAKLIWGEASAVVMEGRSNPRQLVVTRDNASAFEALVTYAGREAISTRTFEVAGDDDSIGLVWILVILLFGVVIVLVFRIKTVKVERYDKLTLSNVKKRATTKKKRRKN